MSKKTYQRQSKQKSLGQTLNGILIGLVLGAIIIATLLWFLNKQKLPSEPIRPTDTVKTEIIVPNKATLPPVESRPAQVTQTEITTPIASSPTSNTNTTIGDTDHTSKIVENMGSTAEKPVQTDHTTADKIVPPVAKKNPVETEQTHKLAIEEKRKKLAAEQSRKREQERKREQAARNSDKPTAEQILEHGSVEKARAANQAQKANKTAPITNNRESNNTNLGKEANATRKVRVQAGSYATQQQAEAQRAKMALLGISAQVESAQVNGKTVHRVRTGRMDENKAAQVRKQLSNNGIDSIAVGAGK